MNKYLDRVMQKSRLLGKYIVLLNGFHLGLCHLQSHLCLSTLVCFVQALETWQPQLDSLDCVLPCQTLGLQRLFQESVLISMIPK